MKKLFLLTILTIFLLSSFAFAQEIQEPQEIQVGLYVLNLGRFDVGTGAFTADFYLDFQCPVDCKEISFEFANGRATSVDKIIDTQNEQFYRIQAQLTSPVDLKDFPFDKQTMQIIIEDKRSTKDKIVYVPNIEESGIDSTITFTGWNLGQWSAKSSTHDYSVYGEKYSRYVFSVDIERIKISSIFKTFLPVFFIVFVMLSSFFLDPDKITTRLSMVGSALVASVMFHISIGNQIPPVGYLTFADKFMVTTYFIVLLSFIMNVFMLELQERKIKEKLVKKIHTYTEYLAIPISAIIYILLFILAL